MRAVDSARTSSHVLPVDVGCPEDSCDTVLISVCPQGLKHVLAARQATVFPQAIAGGILLTAVTSSPMTSEQTMTAVTTRVGQASVLVDPVNEVRWADPSSPKYWVISERSPLGIHKSKQCRRS